LIQFDKEAKSSAREVNEARKIDLTNEATIFKMWSQLRKGVKKMETVGIRELKTNLSRYLSKVKSGKKIIITDRKKEVAVIVPISGETEEEKLIQLMQKGIVLWSGGKPKGIASPIVSKGKEASLAVLEGRR
jgi:prevent-host-death family protein